MTKLDVLYSGFKWDHHDDDSGYHHLVSSVGDYVDGGALWGGDSEIGSRKRRVNFLLNDLVTLFRSWRYKAVVVFYPEQTAYFSAPLLRLMGKRVVYVLHLGEDYWFERSDSVFLKLKRFNLRFVSCFIVLTSHQQAVFERRFPGRVVKIPHGTYCDAGVGAVDPLPSPTVTVVGDNYRDYGLLAAIIRVFGESLPEIRFNLVGMKYDKLGELRHASNVICHGRLSREDYQALIERSLFVLLPLTFATANNALLEGLRAGVPVICNRVDGVLEYLPGPEYAFDTPDELLAMARRQLGSSRDARNAERAHLLEYVQREYAWDVVRRRVRDYALG